MSRNTQNKGAGSFGGNFFKDFYFSQGDYRWDDYLTALLWYPCYDEFCSRSQEKVTKDEGAKQDLMERQDSDSEKVSEGEVFILKYIIS